MIDKSSWAIGLAALAMVGCAKDPQPLEQLRLSEQALQQAKAVGADAQLEELKLAEDKFNRARQNMDDEDYKRARILAEQAELDARLAEAKVLTRKSQDQLVELNGRIERLRKQVGEQP